MAACFLPCYVTVTNKRAQYYNMQRPQSAIVPKAPSVAPQAQDAKWGKSAVIFRGRDKLKESEKVEAEKPKEKEPEKEKEKEKEIQESPLSSRDKKEVRIYFSCAYYFLIIY